MEENKKSLDWGLNAPQFVDFDASDRSNDDEFFDFIHEDLESPDDYLGISSSANNTPKSGEYLTPISTPGSPVCKTRSEKKKSRAKSAMTPREFILKKSAMVVEAFMNSGAMDKGNESKKTEKKLQAAQNDLTTPEVEVVQKITGKTEMDIKEMEVAAKAQIDDEKQEYFNDNCPLIEINGGVSLTSTKPQSIIEDINIPKDKIQTDMEIIVIKPSISNADVTAKITPNFSKVLKDSEKANVAGLIPTMSDKCEILEQRPPKKNFPKSSEVIPVTNMVRELPKKLTNITKSEGRFEPSKQRTIHDKVVKSKSVLPTVATSSIRRYSISKARRRTSNRYVSLAEQITKFHHGTPKRFRSTSQKANATGPLTQTRQTMTLTYARSPLLRCKFRARAPSASTREELEKLHNPEARKRNIKADQQPSLKVNRPASSVLQSKLCTRLAVERNHKDEKMGIEEKSKSRFNPVKTVATSFFRQPPSKIEKKPATITSLPVPIPLSKIQKKPTSIPDLISTLEKTALETPSSKAYHSRSTTMTELPRGRTPNKKFVPTVVSTDEGATIADVEIQYFGVPVIKDHKKITRPIPFSFESRNKVLQNKKDNLKKLVNEDKSRTLFRARPAPSSRVVAAKPATTTSNHPEQSVPKKETASKPKNTALCTLTFQERNERVLQKKKDLFNQIVQQEKQARVFHAKPVPNFRPVIVRGSSVENFRSEPKTVPVDGKNRGTSITTRQRCASQGHVTENKENKI